MKILKKKRLQKRLLYKRKIQHSNSILQKGDMGIVSLDNYPVSKRELECCRLLLRRELKKKAMIFIRCDVSIPITNKATGVRMGKGKGDIEYYRGFLSKNECFIELKGVSLILGMKLLKKLSYKLPFRIGIVK